MLTRFLPFRFLVSTLLFSMLTFKVQAQSLPASERYVDNEVLVKLAPGIEAAGEERVALDLLGAHKLSTIYGTEVQVWQIPDMLTINGRTINNPEELGEYLKNSPHPYIEYAEPNYIYSISLTPNDPMLGSLWGMNKIQAPQAWDTETDCSDVVVGVIDTGIDWTHPDLVNNIWQNLGEDADGDGHVLEYIGGVWQFDPGDIDGIDNDGNGYADDFIGWDFKNNDNNPMDDNSHGTHCAGTIGAQGNNGLGVVGVCWQVKLMGLKFFGASGQGGYTSDAVAALNYATNMGIKITNNSWGGGGYSQTLYNAILNAQNNNSIFVAAAGNSANNNDDVPHYPSSYTLPNIISVAATTPNDILASFSNYGTTSVDLAAPGTAILSTVLEGAYSSYSGTSMAAPHVAGAAALVYCPGMGYADIKAAILSQVDVVPELAGKCVTGGRLNVFKALNNANCCNALSSFTLPAGNCVNQPLTFVNTSTGATSYQWLVNNVLQSTGTNLSYTFASSGTYTITLIAANATCNHASTQDITITALPESGFTYTKNGLILSVSATTSIATSYLWNFGDGNTSNGQNAVHTYTTFGTYSVCLSVSNSCGINNSCQSISVSNNPCDGIEENWTTYNSASVGLPFNSMFRIVIDLNGNKWIGSGGLSKFDGENWTTYNTSNSGLPSNNVTGIAIDTDGVKWIGTSNAGLAKYDGINWTVYNTSNSELPSYIVHPITIDASNNKWIGTNGGGLAKFDGTNWTHYWSYNSGLPNNSVKEIVIDAIGNKWIGTYGGGLSKFDGTNWTTYNISNSGLPHNYIESIVIDPAGVKWIGTWGGLAKFDGTNWTIYNTSNSLLPNNYVFSISIDAAGNKWIGTNLGVSKFDGTNWTTYNSSNSGLYYNSVVCIVLDENENKWIGSIGAITVLSDCPSPCPSVPSFTNNPITCAYGPTIFTNTSTNATNYQWYVNGINVSTDTDLTYTFPAAGSYILKLEAYNGTCFNEYTQTVTVSSDCVWPGDANADGVVNMMDWLALGLAYNKTGAPRSDQTIGFSPKPAANFTTSFTGELFTGINHKHADCSGSGIVNAADTTAIVQNFGQSSGTGPASTDDFDNFPEALISSEANTPVVALNNSAFIDITLQNTVNGGAINCYGLAFTLQYDGVNPRLHFGGSCFGTPGVDFIASYKVNTVSKLLYVGITRINHTNVSAIGKVATLEVTVDELPAGDPPLYSMPVTGASVTDNNGYLIPMGAGATASMQVFEYLAQEQAPLLNAKVLLQGAIPGDIFIGAPQMNTTLRSSNLLPVQQPYHVLPWFYPGTESAGSPANLPSNAVDWVLLEFRHAVTNAIVWQKAAILLNDGSIQDAINPIPGRVRLESTLTGDLVSANQSYYLIVRHRNHLAVASSTPLPISGNLMTFNFTLQPGAALGSNQLTPVGGQYAMKAGDVFADGVIHFGDYNAYATNPNMSNQYHRNDCNLDGNVNATDFQTLAPNISSIGVNMVRYNIEL
ncbi:MAG: S8 family serine peptidase [Sphingobacteriales bacterium]|nr:MAG: S8 family serine peptidase [Sphingobacteriales bacterium]